MSGGFKLHVKEENRIIHVVPGARVYPELDGYPEYVSKLRQITKICINNELEHSWCELVHPHSTQWIETFHGMNYELAVIWFEGTWPFTNEFEEELLKLHDGEWKNERWFAAGHIMNRESQGRYPYWHHQCIVINLQAYADSGFPNLNKHLAKRPAYEASKENFHDDYTPIYLEPKIGDRPELVETRHNYLDALIPNGLKLGYKIMNLPQQVRDHKHCCYPEDEVDETSKWILDSTFLNDKTPEQSLKFGYNLSEDKMELYGFKNQQTQVLYITNTESIPKFDKTGVEFTHMMLPCSGLNQLWHLGNHIDTLERVTFFDFNPYAIDWTNLVLKEYDPKTNFTEFYENNIQRVIGDGVISPECCLYNPELVTQLIESMGGQEQWERKIDQIRDLEIVFKRVNIVKDWEKFAEASGEGHNLFVNLTNIWQYEVNYLNTDGFDAQLNFIKLINSLNQRHPNVFFTGNTPGGLHYTYQNAKLLTGVN